MFRTRVAPSPTGYLHLGFVRTVLFGKLMAIKESGVCYFRLEDTDQNRLMAESPKKVLSGLSRLGLDLEEGCSLHGQGETDAIFGIYQNGSFGPYIQSLRNPIYHQHAQNLIDRRLAYWSYISPEEKENLQKIKQVTKQPIDYFTICSDKSGDKLYQSIQQGLEDSAKPALLYKIKRGAIVHCSDILLGPSQFDLNLEEDFTILKSDGFPSYHLAHLIDDNLMQTSLVIRTQEWGASLGRHTQMFVDYWGIDKVPGYMHLPFVLGTTGNKKMSKRDGNVNTELYFQAGYTEEAIINYLAFLGWNPGTDKELYLDQNDFS